MYDKSTSTDVMTILQTFETNNSNKNDNLNCLLCTILKSLIVSYNHYLMPCHVDIGVSILLTKLAVVCITIEGYTIMLEHVHSYVNTAHYVPIKCNIKILVQYYFHKIIVKNSLVHLESMQSDSEAEVEDTQSCFFDISGIIIEDDGEGEDTF